MAERILKVDPGLRWTYVQLQHLDDLMFDVLVDGPVHWQARDIVRIVHRFDVEQVDVDFTGIGIILAHDLTDQLDIPVVPWLAP